MFDGRPGIVLSPHPDDAVLSAWTTLRAAADVRVIDVCTAVPADGVLGRFDPAFGVTESAPLMRERLLEDAEALAIAGRAATHLDFLDDQYRDVPLDAHALRDALATSIGAAEWLCAPAGIGVHPDHVVVRDVALTVAAERDIDVHLYAELPYAVNWGWPGWVTGIPPRPHLVPDARWRDDLRGLHFAYDDLSADVVRLDDDEVARKTRALECYRTQFEALNAGPLDRLRHPEIIRFELRWRVPPRR
jgi:LmbE family N-acetylglucosaminyl deacetylase